jgi:hypothetical protein
MKNLKSFIALTGRALWRKRHVSPVRNELDFYIPEDDILHSHRRDTLRSCIVSKSVTNAQTCTVIFWYILLTWYFIFDSSLYNRCVFVAANFISRRPQQFIGRRTNHLRLCVDLAWPHGNLLSSWECPGSTVPEHSPHSPARVMSRADNFPEGVLSVGSVLVSL